jgi:DNA-binding XRE family transcriptional regulator
MPPVVAVRSLLTHMPKVLCAQCLTPCRASCIMLPIMRNAPNRTHAQSLVTLRTGRPVEEVLRDLYIDHGLSQADIAAELGITRMTVAMWLREFGIEKPALTA